MWISKVFMILFTFIPFVPSYILWKLLLGRTVFFYAIFLSFLFFKSPYDSTDSRIAYHELPLCSCLSSILFHVYIATVSQALTYNGFTLIILSSSPNINIYKTINILISNLEMLSETYSVILRNCA